MFLGSLVIIFIPKLGVECHDLLKWPLAIAIIEFVFVSIIIAIWFIFTINNCMRGLCYEAGFNVR